MTERPVRQQPAGDRSGWDPVKVNEFTDKNQVQTLAETAEPH